MKFNKGLAVFSLRFHCLYLLPLAWLVIVLLIELLPPIIDARFPDVSLIWFPEEDIRSWREDIFPVIPISFFWLLVNFPNQVKDQWEHNYFKKRKTNRRLYRHRNKFRFSTDARGLWRSEIWGMLWVKLIPHLLFWATVYMGFLNILCVLGLILPYGISVVASKIFYDDSVGEIYGDPEGYKEMLDVTTQEEYVRMLQQEQNKHSNSSPRSRSYPRKPY